MKKTITRTSTKFPGLIMELVINSQEAWVTFKRGAAFESFRLVAGQALNVDCSDRDSLSSLEMRHCLRTAILYAEKLNRTQTRAA